MIFFLCFGFVAVVPGNPETQTVSLFLPESLEAVAKKVTEVTTALRVAPRCINLTSEAAAARRLFRCERSYNFLKARIAAERVPSRVAA